jgi:GDPmannose 4,6-dehydratase
LVTGANGQIGHYLTRELLAAGYKVAAVVRDLSKVSMREYPEACEFIEADITDPHFISVVKAWSPDYVYNMAGFSHIGNSFKQPEMALETNVVPVIRLLEAAREQGFTLVQASSYEVFAGNPGGVVSEKSTIMPVSPYSIAKSAADQYIRLARNNGTKALSVFLGNCESIRRPNNFVTSKVVNYFRAGDYTRPLQLGYIDAIRDWGYAGEYAKIMATMPVVMDGPVDIMLATGYGTTVRSFIQRAARLVEKKVIWNGQGVAERGIIIDADYERVGDIVISSDLYRPADVPRLIGCNHRCRSVLGVVPRVTLDQTIGLMMYGDRHVVAAN